MAQINRSPGVTPSEKYLATLADKAFLNLWSYPNVFNDRRQGGKGDGKELCDLLVVCGDDVLIFSDKSIGWKQGEFSIAWSRWYRSAIEKSVTQIAGAERWLALYPDRIFLDAACTERLPIELPPVERRRVHGIVVALGAGDACQAHYKGNDRSFRVAPDLKGSTHTETDANGFVPFGIGDVHPDGSFVHVFDDSALDLLLGELDTVTDFTEYLVRREQIIRSGHLAPVSGEREMLAYYLVSQRPDGAHDFIKPGGGDWADGERLTIPNGTYNGLAANPSYKAKKIEDEDSYVWDRLIRQFTDNIVAGTAVSVWGDVPEAREAEQGLRSMALEPRLHRRLLGKQVAEAMLQAETERRDRFVRVMLPGPSSPDEEIAYILLIAAYPKIELKGGYNQYRRVRSNTLQAYCMHVLNQNRHLKRAVGVAIDASSKVTGRQGGSEDLIALEIEAWSPELEQRATELREKFDVMKEGRVRKRVTSVDEFPALAVRAPDGMNRKQRRAQAAKARKARR